MADKELEPDDPFQPLAVALSTPGYDGVDAMARCCVEEFALMGWPPARVCKLFTVPDFAGCYAIYQSRGAGYVRQIIASVFGEPFETEPVEERIQLTPVLRRTAELEGGPHA